MIVFFFPWSWILDTTLMHALTFAPFLIVLNVTLMFRVVYFDVSVNSFWLNGVCQCQGGVFSPTLFMIYIIDDLLLKFEKQGILEAWFCQRCLLMHFTWCGVYPIINKCMDALQSFILMRMRWWMGKDEDKETRNERFSKCTWVVTKLIWLFHLFYETLLS